MGPNVIDTLFLRPVRKKIHICVFELHILYFHVQTCRYTVKALSSIQLQFGLFDISWIDDIITILSTSFSFCALAICLSAFQSQIKAEARRPAAGVTVASFVGRPPPDSTATSD